MTYERNYLSQVLVRVDLAEPIPWTETLPREILAAARAGFPIVETSPYLEGGVAIRADESGGHVEHLERPIRTEWAFTSAEQNRQLRIGPTYLLVVCGKFQSYSGSLAGVLEPVWSAVLDKTGDLPTRRLGLRYVNNLPQLDDSRDVLDWTNVVKKRICSLLSVPNPEEALTRGIGIAEYNFGDCMLRFQFGMPNPDYPSPLRQKMFLLDYDCYLETPVESSEVMPVLDSLKGRIEAMFEASITPAFRKHLEGA